MTWSFYALFFWQISQAQVSATKSQSYGSCSQKTSLRDLTEFKNLSARLPQKEENLIGYVTLVTGNPQLLNWDKMAFVREIKVGDPIYSGDVVSNVDGGTVQIGRPPQGIVIPAGAVHGFIPARHQETSKKSGLYWEIAKTQMRILRHAGQLLESNTIGPREEKRPSFTGPGNGIRN